MEYLNLDLDYFDHPKTKRLVGVLGRGADILPVRLWCYCGKYHADSGDLTGYSPTDLETLIGWWGQPGRALEALLQPFQGRPGFLERTENGFKIHDWEKINGHIHALKVRAQVAAKARWDKYRDANAMLEHSLGNAVGNALTLPSQPSLIPPLPPKGKNKRERRPFQKPTVEQVREYCLSRKNGIDAQLWWDSYERVGWVVGKNRSPMVDWQSAVRTWENNHNRSQPQILGFKKAKAV